ncbi:hypothetical protein D3C80_1186290 [compost metagenome]
MGTRAQDLENLLADLLRTVQRNVNVPGFGLCKTCRFHRKTASGGFCELTQEPLTTGERDLICREHQLAEPTE